MDLSPEQSARLKKVALTGATLALASYALKNTRIFEDKIRQASFYEASQSIFIDLVEDSKARITRLAGTVIRDADGEITDVQCDDNGDLTEEQISELEKSFELVETTETEQLTPLQTD